MMVYVIQYSAVDANFLLIMFWLPGLTKVKYFFLEWAGDDPVRVIRKRLDFFWCGEKGTTPRLGVCIPRENSSSKRYMHPHVHCTAICNSKLTGN